MKKSDMKKAGLAVLMGLASQFTADAQFTLTGTMRTRTEVRNGLGNLVKTGSDAAVFTSQRTRLNFGYKWDRVVFGAAIQDVRVWGQDASTITPADGAKLMLHEGWADITLANKADTTIRFKLVDLLSIKIGRQELIYDDVRLIGNLDWLQQARRHDMVLLKGMHRGWQFDIGAAFNQNTDAFNYTGTTYAPANTPQYMANSKGVLVAVPAGTIPNGAVFTSPPGTNAATQDYKSFKSVYISRKFKQTKFSGLFFNDDFGKYKNDTLVGTAGTGYLYGKNFNGQTGTSSRYTYGLMVNHTMGNASGFGKIAFQGAYYAQTGKDRDGKDMNAYHYTLAATYQKGNWSFTPGYDVLSGNETTTAATDNNRFDPLYGTPHKHWGYMDYFYVGTGSPVGGLNNGYFKVKYATNTLQAGVDFHTFALNKDMKKANGTVIDKQLGTEIDFLLNYQMNKFTNLEVGYSIMKATDSMPFAKGQATADAVANTYDKTGTWAYLMVKITPDFFYAKPVAIKN